MSKEGFTFCEIILLWSLSLFFWQFQLCSVLGIKMIRNTQFRVYNNDDK